MAEITVRYGKVTKQVIAKSFGYAIVEARRIKVHSECPDCSSQLKPNSTLSFKTYCPTCGYMEIEA